jgi:TolB-like protein
MIISANLLQTFCKLGVVGLSKFRQQKRRTYEKKSVRFVLGGGVRNVRDRLRICRTCRHAGTRCGNRSPCRRD